VFTNGLYRSNVLKESSYKQGKTTYFFANHYILPHLQWLCNTSKVSYLTINTPKKNCNTIPVIFALSK